MNRDDCNDFLGASRKFACIFGKQSAFATLIQCITMNLTGKWIISKLLVSRKRESLVGQALIVPGGISLPFPWNIIFPIYIVKNGYYCKFCSRNIFYSILFRYRRCRCRTLLYLPLVYFACELRPSGSPQSSAY